MRILKFGGTSVGSAAALDNVVEIIRDRRETGDIAVVVSALSGVTSDLVAAATTGDASIAARLRIRHRELLRETSGASWNGTGPAADSILRFVRETLRRPQLSAAELDALLGAGERLSAILVATLLRRRGIDAVAIDGTDVIRTDASHGSAAVDIDATRALLVPRIAAARPAVPVIAGFIGSTADGVPTTLGRGGSDTTAGVVGAILGADEVEIWSDVDGIFDADPRVEPSARVMHHLSHDEALVLARRGAKVLHPDTIPPLARRGIRLSVRNTMQPHRRGTTIGPPRLEVFIAGATGNVGSALWRQIERLKDAPLSVRGVANSRRTLLDRLPTARSLMDHGVETRWSETLRALDGRIGPRLLFVDCTPSSEVASLYGPLLERGIGVVTANKLAGAGPGDNWDAIRSLASRRGIPLRYETTVGAALPVLDTARSLVATGDRILGVDAVLSGSLSFVLGRLHEGIAFSVAVREAAARGFTEPDPFVDLSGEDVARKLVILLRELGMPVELRDIVRQPLASRDRELASADDVWCDRVTRANARGTRLVYAASFANGIASAAVQEVAGDSPMARLRPGENIVIFTTERYRAVPLTVMGPGAGAEVTAAGVLAEILDVARSQT
ncbi:MAG: aspartate kinase [Thermoanaerobaculia bacterium]